MLTTTGFTLRGELHLAPDHVGGHRRAAAGLDAQHDRADARSSRACLSASAIVYEPTSFMPSSGMVWLRPSTMSPST